MELECFTTQSETPPLVPGRPNRAWMDAFLSRFPYRCLPLVMANTTGWEILSPYDFTIEWNGGPSVSDVVIYPDDMMQKIQHFVVSHFSRGIVTFHTGFLFRTPPGWALWATGAPNHIKDGIAPLSGLTETDWLPFPFTMNWVMTRPGIVRFEKDEPFCFITPVENKKIDAFQPVIKSLDDDAELKERYEAWRDSRDGFNKKLAEHDKDAVKAGWQKYYFKGEMPDNLGEAPPDHMNRRRLKTPKTKVKKT
jgi:hypothetical protein